MEFYTNKRALFCVLPICFLILIVNAQNQAKAATFKVGMNYTTKVGNKISIKKKDTSADITPLSSSGTLNGIIFEGEYLLPLKLSLSFQYQLDQSTFKGDFEDIKSILIQKGSGYNLGLKYYLSGDRLRPGIAYFTGGNAGSYSLTTESSRVAADLKNKKFNTTHVTTAAFVGLDYNGMKSTLRVNLVYTLSGKKEETVDDYTLTAEYGGFGIEIGMFYIW